MPNTIELDLFDFENGTPPIEYRARQNGMLYWLASEFMLALGYAEYSPAMKPIQKARQVMMSLDIDASEHFREEFRDINGKRTKDIKLSRFACYLVSMNSDTKKPQVAKAQTYFASLAEYFQNYIQNHVDIERVILRDEVKDHESSLSRTAKFAGIIDYAYFQSKGYQGLYNMILPKIKKRKGIPDDRSPLDYMGAEELGANIFRITQTEAKIRRENINGQSALENAAYEVGKTVRNTIDQMGGTMPEDLPAAEDIKKIKSDLKKTNKGFIRGDKNCQNQKKIRDN